MSAKLDAFVRGATRMPALPVMMKKLFSALNNPAFSVSELSKIISTDTSLSAKVLKMANSAFYFRQENVSTVQVAAVRLGHKTIRSLVLTVWTQTFKTFPLKADELDLVTALLEHGTTTAVGANLLIQPVQAGLAEETYIAGLLHDIGRLALVCQLGRSYENDVLNRAMAEQKDIREIENQVLGFDHAMLGARLLQSWHIAPVSVHAAAEHHRAEVNPAEEPVVAAVALADDLATRKGHNVAENALRQNRDNLMAFFNLTDLPAFEEKWDQKLQELSQALEDL
ncbi:MAG: HDOD domain-containing protein [Magnetococcus sp. WYHC-3]